MGNEADVWEDSPEHQEWVESGEEDGDEELYLEQFNQRELRQRGND